MTFEEARAQFPILERVAYLNAGTFGPLATAVAETIRREIDEALTLGRMRPELFERWFEIRERVRASLAATIGVPVEHVALTSSTTEGCNVVLAGLGLSAADEVVTTDAEHFGLVGPLSASAANVRVAKVRERPAADAFEAIRAEVTPATKLIAISHVSWFTGHAFPWHELREATGVPVLVDGAQSAGAIEVDATAADFYTVSAQKWLCGPDLTGALYVRDPERLRLALPSYLSQESYDLVEATFVPKAGGGRFDTSFTPLATLAALETALSIHPSWRYDRARDAAARCRELLAGGFDVVTEPGHSTLVAFRPDGDAAETSKRLAAAGVIVRDLPGTGLVRVSCGWWTSDADLDRLVAALEAD